MVMIPQCPIFKMITIREKRKTFRLLKLKNSKITIFYIRVHRGSMEIRIVIQRDEFVIFLSVLSWNNKLFCCVSVLLNDALFQLKILQIQNEIFGVTEVERLAINNEQKKQ